MKITAVITDADIRYYIDQAATELEEDNQIRFPDSDARAEFIEDCVSSEIDKYELYERDPFGYTNCTNAIPSAIARITGLRFSTWLTCTNTRSTIDTCVFP